MRVRRYVFLYVCVIVCMNICIYVCVAVYVCTVEFHLSVLILTSSHPDMQNTLIIGFFLENGGLKFGCYYLQYAPASKPFDHATFEALEAITPYCT
jgi:hypothetical protein